MTNGAGAQKGTESTQPAPGGPGPIDGFLDPFANALLATAKVAEREPVGDPGVIAAFKLGWLMGEILASRHAPPVASILASDPSAVYAGQGIQLKALATQLRLGGSDELTALETALATGSASEQAKGWEPGLLTALLGAGVHFAKAYGLGRQLDELTHEEQLRKERFERADIEEMLALLDDLSTALPPHAARGVANSLRQWQAQASLTEESARLLTVQGQLWRTALVGDKKATELLEPQNYIDAAERLAGKLSKTAISELRRHIVWVVLVVVLFVGGLTLLLITPKHPGGTAAGLSAVLAALGLTWKGLGGTLGKLVGKLEAPLWGAELDGAVTDAVTLVPSSPRKGPLGEAKTPDRDYARRSARPILPAGAAQPAQEPPQPI